MAIQGPQKKPHLLELGYHIFRPTYVCHCQNMASLLLRGWSSSINRASPFMVGWHPFIWSPRWSNYRSRPKSADFEDIGSTAIIHGFPGTFWFSIPSCPSFCGRFPRFLPLRCLARMAQVPTQLKMVAFGVLAIVTNFLQNTFHYSESSLQQSAHLTLIDW